MTTRSLPAGLGIDLYQAVPPVGHSQALPSRHIIPTDVRDSYSAGANTTSVSTRDTHGPHMAKFCDLAIGLGTDKTTTIFEDRSRIGSESMNAHGNTQVWRNQQGTSALDRSDTLLGFGASPARNAAQLKSLLGNSSSRLRSKVVIPREDLPSGKKKKRAQQEVISLEQAKHRARVEVDIVLESNTYVQGDFLRGHVKLNIRKRSKKDAPVSIAEGKVRVIGFETIPNEDDRHTFYQCAAPLSAITDSVQGIYSSSPDPEGYAQAVEGAHVLPFAMRLPTDATFGASKGVVNVHSGVAVRYIAMISVKVKDAKTDKRSIAHFYRSCEIWPRLNSSIALAAAPRPIQASTSRSLAVVGSGAKVKLTALLHRLTWVAGQRCYVKLSVANGTKKTLKSLNLTLVRTTTLFKPKPAADTGHSRSADPDACQKSTMHRPVAETVLEIAQQGAKGHASAKGWWTGVGPGQELEFSHYILLPPDALSITRGRILEVEYSIRVTLSAGPLTPDVFVTLPVKIINFLSIDPTPCLPLLSADGAYTRLVQRRRSIDGELSSGCPSSLSGFSSTDSGLASSSDPSSRTLSQDYEEADGAGPSHLRITNPDAASPLPSASDSNVSSRFSAVSSGTSHTPLGNLELDDPDSDEEVGAVLGQAGTRDGSQSPRGRQSSARWGARTVAERGKRGRSRFAQRVQEKLAAVALADEQGGSGLWCSEGPGGDSTPRMRHFDSTSSAGYDAPTQRRAAWLSATLPRPPRTYTNVTELTDVTASYSMDGHATSLSGTNSSTEGIIGNYADRSGPSSPASVYSAISDSFAPLEPIFQPANLDRPLSALSQTGSSSHSVVRGRIAQLEQLLQDP